MAKKPTLTVSCCELPSAAYAVRGENIIHTHTKTSNAATYFFALKII
jgi:maleate cis-trans isomerase